ncbi:hypothetical protein [Prosthecobacter sp.]|uniref:EF-hand domain-containing protein n=1 Tax=Prosthecobacter sp. TaxID=1965333 RepID=UPI001DECA512|nr:hypothetical protein [Prosthecobacter sp.]MCB1275203.1 hypothetical protein [Prosthecobacter sp.]
MNTHLISKHPFLCSLAPIVALLTLSTTVRAATDDDEKDLAIGEIVRVEGNGMVVGKKGEERTIQFPKDVKVAFVGFKGIGQPTDTPKAGYGIRAAISGGDTVKTATIVPAVPPLEQIPDKHKRTAAELFKVTDENQNGAVDYVEYSHRIEQSFKHMPANFPRMDKDGDDVLNLEEFTASLDHLDWWVFSRKPAEEWVRIADIDKSGEIEEKELGEIIFGHHTDFAKNIRELDLDKSGGLSAVEFQGYMDRKILGVKSPRKPKKSE